MKRSDRSGLATGNPFRLVCPAIAGIMILIHSSCSQKRDTYSILEFSGAEKIMNYSKSFFLWQNESEDKSPVPIAAEKGDLIACGDYIFVYDSDSSDNSFLVESNDSIMYINGKIFSITIPHNEGMVPWFRTVNDLDLSSLQFLNCDSASASMYFPYLKNLAEIRSDPGISFTGKFRDMAELLSVFKPEYLIQPTIYQSDFEELAKLENVRILMVTLGDPEINEPLPALPELEQIFILEDGEKVTNNLFVNNRQIRKVIINNPKLFDFSILDPLADLQGLVISDVDSMINVDLINSHKKLELLSVTGENSGFDPGMVKLSSLRWMTFFTDARQSEFDSFINLHRDLEILELIANDSIKNLKPLTGIKNLAGLIVTDTVTDIASIKELKSLKYLSLPSEYLKRDNNEAGIRKSLPDARLAANEGFCLGSGWLLLIIPLIIMFRSIMQHPDNRKKGKISH
jgi:hypothetical protein